MSRLVLHCQSLDTRMFYFCNHKIRHRMLDKMLPVLTHLGGAVFTILFTLGFALFAVEPWKSAGWTAFVSLAVSHLPIALIKKICPRRRPYMVMANVNVCKHPLKDHSFPSGHTTAVFSIVVPFVLANVWLGAVLLPLAVLVGFSRIYLGLHYPTDCIAGGLIGTAASLLVVIVMGPEFEI